MRTGHVRMRDPFVLEPEPGRFVLFGTTDENLWGGPATGFDCYTSSDLEHWDGPFPVFRPPAVFWADTQFWAPEVHRYRGRFFLIATFAASATRRRGVAVLVADEPTGPYRPWSDGPVTPRHLPCLDGTLFVDDAAHPWLVYSRGAEGALTSDTDGRSAASTRRAGRNSCRDRPDRAARAASSSRTASGTSRIVTSTGMHAVCRCRCTLQPTSTEPDQHGVDVDAALRLHLAL